MSRDRYGEGTDDIDRTRPEGLTGILDALTTAITTARAMPMSSSVLVNRAELLDLVDQARDVLPAQLGRADEVLADADSARAAAQAEAEAVLASARERAALLVDTEAVVVAARDRADEIVRGAQETAEGLRRDADDYCDRRLADFEIDLGKLVSQVQAGRARLADRLGGLGQG
jgi:cell division septum initiation protein DivIVA